MEEGGMEEEDFGEEPQQVIANANPNFLISSYHTVVTFLAAYGWFVVFGVVLLIIIWSNIEKKVKKAVERVKSKNGSDELSAEMLAKRAEAMELARQRMQEKASAILKKEAERRKELEEQKRSEKIDDYDAMKSGRSSVATQRKLNQNETLPSTSNAKPKPAARPLRANDYNPLTGTSESSARYRPAPRRGGGG